MKDKETLEVLRRLDALQRDAEALPESQDRQDALKAVADLKAAYENPPPPRYPRSPDFRNYGLVALLKLMAGTVAALVLLFALMFLVMPIGDLIRYGLNPGSLKLLILVLGVIVPCCFALYFLGRKSKAEREALEANPVAREFAKRKLLFQVSSLGLFFLFIFTIGALARYLHEASALVATVGFGLGYWALGRKLWRCPACGAQLPFWRRYQDRQSIPSCPGCHARLQ